jgi:hypothetical protein
MTCCTNLKKRIENFKESKKKKILVIYFIIEFIQTSVAIGLGINSIIKWVKFTSVDYENNGYYFFVKGINQSKVNLNSCSLFISDSRYYFDKLCIKNEFLISLQFWSSLIILFVFQLVDLIVPIIEFRRGEIKVDRSKQLFIKDIKSLKYLLKFLFIPGVFVINNFQFKTGCIKIEIDYFEVLRVIYVTYLVLPYTFAFVVVAIITMFIQYFNENCFSCFNEKLLRFLKFASLFSLTLVLLVSVFLWWISLAGSAISIIDSAFLVLIIIFDFINTQIYYLIK